MCRGRGGVGGEAKDVELGAGQEIVLSVGGDRRSLGCVATDDE